MGLLMEFLNGWRSDAIIGRSLSLNGEVVGEPLCLAMTSGLIAALRSLNCGEGYESWSSDVDGVRGGGPESEGGMDNVEEAQGRSEERVEMGECGNLKETSMNVKLNEWTSQGTAPEWEKVDDRDVGMWTEGCRLRPISSAYMRAKPPQTPYTFRAFSFPSPLHCQTHELGRPRFITV